ncbi:hypothetical protein N0V86_004119 [Didymella sp. IMI 355093]|nr:hypothetical protein N0V86_004119 [Didymella sp. IMI 355093]
MGSAEMSAENSFAATEGSNDPAPFSGAVYASDFLTELRRFDPQSVVGSPVYSGNDRDGPLHDQTNMTEFNQAVDQNGAWLSNAEPTEQDPEEQSRNQEWQTTYPNVLLPVESLGWTLQQDFEERRPPTLPSYLPNNFPITSTPLQEHISEVHPESTPVIRPSAPMSLAEIKLSFSEREDDTPLNSMEDSWSTWNFRTDERRLRSPSPVVLESIDRYNPPTLTYTSADNGQSSTMDSDFATSQTTFEDEVDGLNHSAHGSILEGRNTCSSMQAPPDDIRYTESDASQSLQVPGMSQFQGTENFV